MTRPLRIVAPFRPFPPESPLHQEFADFDWIDAIQMMRDSAERACHCPVHVITDIDTDLPVPCLKYVTEHRRLMLWYLEVSLRYLESDDFDRDTVSLDSDQLVYADLRQLATANADLVVCIRPTAQRTDKSEGFPILNGVQVWMHRHKSALVDFYRQVLTTAEQLPEDRLVWGADTDALQQMLEPLALGLQQRAGLTVHMVEARTVIEPFAAQWADWIARGVAFWPSKAVVDFRWKRKRHMRAMFEHTIRRGRVAA